VHSTSTIKTHLALRALAVALLAGCGGVAAPMEDGGPGEAGLVEPNDVASVRLFDQRGTELTNHMALLPGTTIRVEVRMYVADGRQVTDVRGGLELGFNFDPDSVASSTPVAEEPLVRVVTPGAPGTPGNLTVILQFPPDMSTKTFGPFDVLVH
jgi:hypothetical protein